MKARRLRATLLAASLAAAAWAGCGVGLDPLGTSSGDSPASSATAGPGGGSATSSSASVASGSGGGAGGTVGGSCKADADCAAGLSCAKSSANDPVLGGGPAGGYCTKACQADTDCPTADTLCLLIEDGQPGRCVLDCSRGPALDSDAELLSPLDPSKCLGREDLRCEKVRGMEACVPSCGSASQCSGKRSCDPRAGVCVDAPSTGSPLGAACSPDDDPTSCAGTCVAFDSGESMCSSECVIGGAVEGSLDCGGIEAGFCAFRRGSAGLGDAGYCTPSCDTHADCQNPSFWCFGVTGLSTLSHKGYCFAAHACEGGQSDCDAKSGGALTCTKTAYGPYCLDSTYSPATGAGGSGAGGGSASSASGTGGSGGAGGDGGG